MRAGMTSRTRPVAYAPIEGARGRLEVQRGRFQRTLTVTTRILLTDTTRWPNSARLAIVLSDAGAHVSVVCPKRRHPLHKVRTVQTRPYSPLRPLDSLLAAIQDTSPEVVIPCDDRAVRHLHELHARMCELGETGDKVK